MNYLASPTFCMMIGVSIWWVFLLKYIREVGEIRPFEIPLGRFRKLHDISFHSFSPNLEKQRLYVPKNSPRWMIPCCTYVCWRFFSWNNFKIFRGALLLLISCISSLIAWFVVIFGINTTSDISELLYEISRAVRRLKFETILKYHEWYLCQISRSNNAIICLSYYPQKFCNFRM